MARRWWVRGVVWTGVGITSLIGVLLVALILVTQSAFGRERVRQVAEQVAGRYLLGSLHLGALRFGPGCALAIDSASLRGPDDSLLVSLGSARATCRFGALVQRRLIITSLDVARPHVVVRQSASGVWNWSRAIRPDTAPPAPSTGPARVVVEGSVHLSDGAVILEVPWAPPDSLRGAARDRAITAALTGRPPVVRRVGTTLVRVRTITAIGIDAPLVRTEIGDTTTIADLTSLSVAIDDPPIAVHRIAGRVALLGDVASVDLPTVAVGQTALRARGRVDWRAAGTPVIDATITADTLALADLAPFLPNVPMVGGGRLELAITSAGGSQPTTYRISAADLHAARSVIRGGVGVEVSASSVVTVTQAALDLAPLHTDLLRIFGGDAIPSALRGGLTGRLVARGNANDGALHIDSLDARYADETVPGSANRVTGHGSITLGGEDGIAFSTLVLQANPIDARTIRRIVPSLPPLTGRLVGTVTLDSTLQHLRLGGADLRYAEGNATPLRIVGGGRIHLADEPTFDLEVNTLPLAPAAFAESYPGLANLPDIDGRFRLRGTAMDLSLEGTASSVGGSVSLVGRYRDGASGPAIHATGKVRDVNARAATGRSSMPDGAVDADVDIDLAGESFSALHGTAALSNLNGTIAGITVQPSNARFTLTESRIVADSVVVSTSAGTVHAHGALGLHANLGDTLDVTASLSLAELGPVLRALGVREVAANDTAQSGQPSQIDSLAGTVSARARLTGSVDSLEADGDVEVLGLTSPSGTVARGRATATMTGLRSTPRGQATLRVDSLTAGGISLSSLTATARSDDGRRWEMAMGTADTDQPGGHARGAVAVHGDTVAVDLDSLAVRYAALNVQLTRPTRLRRDGDGTITLDTTELRGVRGTLLSLFGVYRDTGSIAVALDVSDAPIFIPGRGGPGDSVRVLLDATARLEGTARAPRGMARMRARLPQLDSMGIDSLVASGSYADDNLQVTVDARAGARSLLAAQASGQVLMSLSPAKVEMLDEPIGGTVSIDSLYLPDITRLLPGIHFTAGVVRTRVTLSGTARRPSAVGMASLSGAVARIDALGIGVRDANVALELASDRITISKATVRGEGDPGGRAELEGVLGLADTSIVDLRLRTTSMALMRQAETADLDVTTDLRLVGPRSRPTLSGRITVDRAALRLPDMGRAGVVGVDDTAFVRLVDSLAPAPIERSTTPAILTRVDIAEVEVAMGPNVWLRSAEASVQLGGSIELEKAVPQPGVADGQIALRGALVTQRGNYRLNLGAFTRSFELEKGSVQFNGEAEMNPRLDINAVYAREADEAARTSGGRSPRVRAHLGGTLELPILTLSSADSKLSQAELMSYLVTGQSGHALGDAFNQGVVTSELVASATSAVAQRLAGGMFDVVNVTPGAASDRDDDSSQSAADAFAASRLGIGKQLTSRLFLKVDAGLCALAGGSTSTNLGETIGVSLDYRFRRGLLGSVSSAPSTNGATCANQSASRGSALTPRQWGLDFDRVWRF